MCKKLTFLIGFVLVLGLAGHATGANLIIAEDLLVDLTAEDLAYGTGVTTWTNHGSLGDFTANGAPVVENLAGVKTATFDGSSWFDGPASTFGIEGAGTRSIEVWAYNPSFSDSEETMLSWAHRGGPDATNMAFNYCSHTTYGAVGHWGGAADMGWWGSNSPAPAASTWWYLVYTYDGTGVRLYVNGLEESVTDPLALNTHGGTPIRVAAQADGTGAGVDGGKNFTGSIAVVRIHDGALSPADILNNFQVSPFVRAWDPDPADGSAVPPKLSGANLCMVLKYEPGKGAVSHTGYFSENYDDVLDRVAGANLGEPPYLEHKMNDYYVGYDDPANIPAFARVSLVRGRTYYWAVDEFDGATTYQGKVWSFTVMPEEAWGPDPFDGAKYVIGDPGATLSWNMGDVDTDGNDVTYEVYYGTDETAVETSTTPDVNVSDPTSTYTTELLLKDTVYYWRVDTKLALSGPPFTFQRRVKGTVWSFTTLADIPITDPTLVGWWTFDEGEGDTAFDWSGHGNHGMINGDPQYVTGQLGSALKLDGDGDYVDCGDSADLTIRDEITLACWIKVASFTRTWETILGKGDNSYRLSRGGGNGNAVHLGCNGTSADPPYFNGVTIVTDDTWHHVAGVYDGANMIIYIDGVEDARYASTGQIDTSTYPFYIGENSQATGRFLGGTIDEVRLYKRALSASEVQHSMDPSKASNPKPNNGQIDVDLSTKLIWTPGDDESTGSPYTKQNVYFGTSFDDVNSATVPITTLTDVNVYSPGALDYYQRYYWRIDGVKAAGEAVKGVVWNFKATYDPANVADPNLMGWYKLDGNANDSSGHGRDGVELNGPTYGVGYDAQAIRLDGADDYVSIEFPQITGDITIAAWVKMAPGNTDGYYGIAGKLTSAGFALVRHSSNVFRLWAGNGDGNLQDTSSDLTYTDTEWHHVAGVIEGGTNYLYVDGVRQTATSTKLITDSGQFAYIGRQYSDYDDRYFNGLIDEVRFYDRALSDTEVATAMRINLALAWGPKPANGETGVDKEPTLSWKPGDYAPPTEGHYVYFGADDPANLALVADQPQSPNNYSPGALDLGRTYYWAVDEANVAAPGGVDAGKIWSFTTIDHLVVDDMESYQNDPNWIFDTWKDGFGDADCAGGNGTGSGLAMSASIYLGGYQSMEYAYDNDGTVTLPCDPQPQEPRAFYSKIEVAIADLPSGIGSDWTAAGAKALSLWFHGSTGNAIESMWVELTDGAGGKATVTYGDYADENPADINETSWHQWNIDLQGFADGGVTLTNVSSIAIGFGSATATTPGGMGLMYFDDIRLYAPRCILSRRDADFAKVDYVEDCVVDYKELEVMAQNWLVTTVVPSDANLVGLWEFDGDTQDSSGLNNHGTAFGFPLFVPGKVGSGALTFDGIDDWVDISNPESFNFATDFTWSAWINTTGNGTILARAPATGNWAQGGKTFILRNGAIGVDIGWVTYFDSGQTVNDGQWHHVATTTVFETSGNNDTTSFFIDGSLVASKSDWNVNAFSEAGLAVKIGFTNDDFPDPSWFTGNIDDVRIYNKVLTEAEVLYLGGLQADLYEDNTINWKDYAVLANSWLDENLFP